MLRERILELYKSPVIISAIMLLLGVVQLPHHVGPGLLSDIGRAMFVALSAQSAEARWSSGGSRGSERVKLVIPLLTYMIDVFGRHFTVLGTFSCCALPTPKLLAVFGGQNICKNMCLQHSDR